VEREAREKREPQARQAKQERLDRSKHCKRRRRGSTKKSKNDREQDSKSIETASPDTRLKPRVGAARRRLGALSWERFPRFPAVFSRLSGSIPEKPWENYGPQRHEKTKETKANQEEQQREQSPTQP